MMKPKITSIRQKVVVVILVVTAVCTLGGFIIEIGNNNSALKKELRNNVTLNARLISEFAVPTLLFDDKDEASKILDRFESIPYIVHASIIDRNDRDFASYTRKNEKQSEKFFESIRKDSLINGSVYIKIGEPVTSKNEKIGEVYIVASNRIIHDQMVEHIKTVVIIVLLIIGVAFIMATIAQRLVTRPILELAKVTRLVQDTGDLSVRAVKSTNDETGLLYERFNELLGSIEQKQKERDDFEKALLSERESLEIRVQERTSELKAAKEKAEESDMLKSAFLANMSHEIRTPLNAILGFSDLIVQPDFDEEKKKEFRDIIDVSAGDLTRLIDDILDISKIEANQLRIKPEICNANELCNQIYATFKQSLESEDKQHEVTPLLSIPDIDTDYAIETDPLRFKQVLINILNNSTKFTHRGSIEFGYYPEQQNKILTFYIKDTGIGIPPDKLDKIFDRFIKVADDTSKIYKGTGLGLSIASKLAKKLNGDIKVESELNKGSIFYVTFPYLEVKQTTKELHKEKTSVKQEFLDGKVILVAEDLDWNFRYLEMILGTFNSAKVLWAKDGKEAVEICREHPEIDLVLMDIQMPEMDGYMATKLIMEFRPGLPVIAHTAYAMYEERERCMNAGCCAYIAKPVRKDELLDEIRMVLLRNKRQV